MIGLMHDAALEARALGMLGHAIDTELGMGQRCAQDRTRNPVGSPRRPVAPARQAAGEDQDIVGVVGDGMGIEPKIFQRLGGPEGRDDEALFLDDQPDGRDMDSALRRLGGDDGLPDQEARFRRRRGRVVPGAFSL